jgi:hypothetical protein
LRFSEITDMALRTYNILIFYAAQRFAALLPALRQLGPAERW